MNNYDDDFIQTAPHLWFRTEFLFRVYIKFMFQLVLSGMYLLHPGIWWISVQVSVITSPLVVNVWNYRHLRLFYQFKLVGLLLVEFLTLQYLTFSRDIGICLLGLIITFGLCSLLYAYTYFTGKVIVLGLPPARTVTLLLTITIISHFKNRVVCDICSYVKYLLVVYCVLRDSYIIQPMLPEETVNASIKLYGNFILVLLSVFVILNYV